MSCMQNRLRTSGLMGCCACPYRAVCPAAQAAAMGKPVSSYPQATEMAPWYPSNYLLDVNPYLPAIHWQTGSILPQNGMSQ